MEAGDDVWVNRYSNGVQKMRVLLIVGDDVGIQDGGGMKTFERSDVFSTKLAAQLANLAFLRTTASRTRKALAKTQEDLDGIEGQITDLQREIYTGLRAEVSIL